MVRIDSLIKSIVDSLSAVGRLLYFRPQYLFLAIAVSLLFYEIIYWILNLGLIDYMINDPSLSWFDYAEIIVGSYAGIFTHPLSGLAILLFSVSFLQGVTLASLVFTARSSRQGSIRAKDFRGLSIAGVLSVIGLGCAACGTSLVLPIISWVFATSSVVLVDAVGFYSALVAFIVSALAAIFAGDKLARSGLDI